MGEVVEENHTFVLPNEQHQYTFTMKYSYDSWNRLQNITYPDGEVVRYSYDCGGMLTKITGEYTVEGSQSHTVDTGGIIFRKGFQLPDIPVNPTTTYHYLYIDSISYNKFGLKEKQFFGNSTRAEYAYDSLQRLKSMVCLNSRNTVFQELFYTYDAVSNITGIRNTASSDLGGPYSFNYEYDTLYRLKNFKGNHQVNSIRYGDTVQMAYHNDGRISRKTQKYTSVLNGNRTAVNNVWNYEYSQTQPHTVSSIENKTPSLSWDANGNMTSSDGTNLTWDEENRLSVFTKGSTNAFYRYDASGERYYKNTTNLIRMNINGNAKLPSTVYANPVLYASPYLVATKQGYTKHYYAGDERFLSKIGDGVITDISNHVKNEAALSAKQYEVDHATPPGSFSGNLEGLLHLTDEMKGKPELYWQHSDHLGSASWITDTSGNAVQHLMYMPWGEPLVDVRNPQISYNARYTFASKERDEESGLSYFGARYYSSDLSIWLSVDPMSDKYPSTSPYAYCRNNPIILVDPNGEFDTRSEARQYRKEHHTGGVIKKNDGKNPWGGNYSIENKKKGSSYTKINYQENESGHFIYGQDDEQVVCGPLISPKNNSERSSAQVLATTGLVCGTLGGDDVTGIGIADDIAIPVVAITGIGILLFKSHKQHASKSNWNRHSETRSGGDPETGRYGQNRNNNRGEKNKKFIPKPNPNKRK